MYSSSLAKPGAQCAVVAKKAVAVQFDKLVEDQIEIIGELGPFLVPGDLHGFPRVEMVVDRLGRFGELLAQLANPLAQFRRASSRWLRAFRSALAVRRWVAQTVVGSRIPGMARLYRDHDVGRRDLPVAFSSGFLGLDVKAATRFQFPIKFQQSVGAIIRVFFEHPMYQISEIGLHVLLQHTESAGGVP